MDNRINIIGALNELGVLAEHREEFLFTVRQFTKDLLESDNISLQLELITKTKFEKFDLLSIDLLITWARSILKNKNQSFGKLLVSLFSNYLNALKYDDNKHVILYYPNGEYWNNIGAHVITDPIVVEEVTKVYRSANPEGLTNTSVVIDGKDVFLGDLKIKTTKNYESSIIAQKVSKYRNEVSAECEARGISGEARRVYIREKVSNYKQKLNS